MDFKDQMIAAVDRGECTDAESYDYVRDRWADAADTRRKADKENPPVLSPEKKEGSA